MFSSGQFHGQRRLYHPRGQSWTRLSGFHFSRETEAEQEPSQGAAAGSVTGARAPVGGPEHKAWARLAC